jgi:subtilisin family serine protease
VAPKAKTNGLQDLEGLKSHAADVAHTTFNVKGAGIKVCVLSNDVTHLQEAQNNGSLGAVTVLPNQAGTTQAGEGTAMLEIVHGIAPDAPLMFATGMTDDVQMATNIDGLANANCKIIVDDVSYFNESPFQDGVITQAVNRAAAKGILYFSSAANNGNAKAGTSRTWEGNFKAGPTGAIGLQHTFDANNTQSSWYNRILPDQGGGNDPHDACPSGGYANLFWSDPLGSQSNRAADLSDYALYAIDETGAVLASDTTTHLPTTDPYREVQIPDNSSSRTVAIVIVKTAGKPDRFLHLDVTCGRSTYQTDGSTRGHNAAEQGISVAAISANGRSTPFQGGPTVGVEYFSSDGPRRMFFKPDGTPYKSGDRLANAAATFSKPDLTAADGITTDLADFAPFYGTSAAAPNAAAIAALIWSYNPNLTAVQVLTAMKTSALRIVSPVGWNNLSGAGVVMADDGVRASDPQARDAAASIANFRDKSIVQTRLSVSPGLGAQYNVQYGGWRLLAPGASHFDINVPVGQSVHDLRLTIRHLSSADWPKAGFSPISIVVNGTMIENNYDVAATHLGSRDYEIDQFYIPASALHQGANTLQLTLQHGARTHYWIDSLRLDP